MLKKIGLILLVIVLVIIAAAGLFFFRYRSMESNVTQAYNNIKPIDMNKVDDGIYYGSFKEFLVAAKVAVEVKDHRIVGVKIVEQECGPGYEASDTTDRIVMAQTAKVDAVTGATGSSKTIMIAVNRALTGE